MPVAIALIVGVVVIATTLIGLVWAMVFLMPFYAYVAVAVYLVRRSNRREAQLRASVKRDTDMQRQLTVERLGAIMVNEEAGFVPSNARDVAKRFRSAKPFIIKLPNERARSLRLRRWKQSDFWPQRNVS